ncbi:uncharacterized protein DDB_G0283357-like [Uranotaenia lowii]|uniref:uncharacterized protein DDB_G0283357-like n=1 Tax=Uranotaenia lowii TaxID=190385 RepID=UPI00247A342B|nr:uncharacterized protein DDB_G0283357-like [Uranotaenia lowii]
MTASSISKPFIEKPTGETFLTALAKCSGDVEAEDTGKLLGEEIADTTIRELLDKTEMEDQEQNFPFTSRPVQAKRISSRSTQGGSLQDLPEAGRHDYFYSDLSFDYYANLGGLGVQTSRRHHGSSSGASVGPGGGDRSTNPRQKQRYTSSVSSRQREGGSLPSNVNVECPFFNDVGHHHATGTITKIKKRDGSKSEYGTMLLTAPLTNAGAEEIISAVAEVAGNAGFCGGMKNTESQLIDVGGSGVSHTVIDMGELESDETQHLLAHDVLQQNLYESSLDELEGGPGDLYGSSTVGTGSSSTGGSGCTSIKKIPRYPPNVTTICTYPKMGDPPSPVRPTSVHHVDKTVSLPMLESNKDITPIQLGSNYQSVKCFMSNDTVKSEQMRHVMMGTISTNNSKFITTTQSFNPIITQQKALDENGNSVQQFNSGLASSSGGLGSGSGLGVAGGSSSLSGSVLTGGKKKRKPLSDRNTRVVIPENIAGYRGGEDVSALVDFIENKDKQSNKEGKSGGGGGSNPKNDTLVKSGGDNAVTAVENGVPEEKGTKKKSDKKKEKAKLKKSNSLEELSSNSKKKQQAEDEQNTQENPVAKQNGPTAKDTESVVSLRSGGKASKKAQNSSNLMSMTSTASLSTSSAQSTKEAAAINVGKRNERRSWGTEELSYLEDTQSLATVAASAASEKAEEKLPKRDSKKDSKDSPALIPFNLNKKRDSMSVESLSALSAGGSAETAEFHVVTKKKKTKKKSPGLFSEENTSAVSSGNTTNRRHLTSSQSYTLGGTSSSRSTHRYQASNTFTNDRDVYMTNLNSSNDVSRRKSTSSVPPSEKSDSSDADSVQSLPIEPSRKQQQQHQSSQHHHQQSSGQSSRGSSGVPQSYADIARIPNADKINNNLGATLSTSPLDSSSVEKWPPVQATTSEDLAQALKSPSAFPELVPDSSLSSQQHQQYQQQHQYVNSSVSSVSSNIVGNSNKATYSQSLLIAATKAPEETSTMAGGKVVSSVNNENNVNSSNSSSNNSSTATNNTGNVSSKSTLSKSKSVDNNDIYYSNEHYPALEKTVKPSKASALQTILNSNSLSETKPVAPVSKVTPAASGASAQSLASTANPASITSTAAAANNASTTSSINTTNNLTGAKKSKKKDFVNTSNSTATSEVEFINNARNVAAVQSTLDAVNNNPVFIENVDSSDYSQNNGLTNRSPNGGLNLQQHPQSTPKTSTMSSSTANAKRNKKEKSSSYNAAINNDQTQANFGSATAQNSTASGNHRPAVIIMNDNNEPNPKHEFTFGFDIDQELLFGDFQEEDMSMLDHQSQQQYQFHQKQPQQQQQQPLHHSNSTDNVPSPTSNTSTDLGYSSMQQSTASPSSSNNSSTSSQIHQAPHHHQHQQQQQQHQNPHQHHHQQQQQQQHYHHQHHQTESFDMMNNSSDPDTYRDSIEHKFHQPPPTMVLAPAPFYSQPPPQLPPQHMLPHQQQQQQQPHQQQTRHSRPPTHGNTAYNLPPPPVHPGHMQQQPPAVIPVMVTKQDNSTNTSPTGAVMNAASPPATATIITVPPPPLPPVVPAAAIPVVPVVPLVMAAAPPSATATVVLVPAGPPPTVAPQAMIAQQPPLANTSIVVPVAVGNVSNINTSLNNQNPTTTAAVSHNSSSSSGCISNSSSSSVSSKQSSTAGVSVVQQQQQQQEPKPQRQLGNNSNSTTAAVNVASTTTATGEQPQAPLREKMKEINLRFIAPEQLQTNHNHDKIVNFVGMAWEDIICGTDAQYYNDSATGQ